MLMDIISKRIKKVGPKLPFDGVVEVTVGLCSRRLGRSFHHLGPAKENARSLKTVLNLGFTYWAAADRKPERPAEDETENRTSLRYGWQRPVCSICVRRHSLYRIRTSTGSQCSWCNPSAMWSRGPRPSTRRAAAFCRPTRWSVAIDDFGRPARMMLQ